VIEMGEPGDWNGVHVQRLGTAAARRSGETVCGSTCGARSSSRSSASEVSGGAGEVRIKPPMTFPHAPSLVVYGDGL